MKAQFRDEEQRRASLTESERETILGIDPSFQKIARVIYFDNYDLPCPIRVEVTTTKNAPAVVVLRRARHGSVETEVEMFRALKECGLPVPEVLAGPFRYENGELGAIYSLLEGESLQALAMRSDVGLQQAKTLLVEAVFRLIEAGRFIADHEVSQRLPRHTLRSELETVKAGDTGWTKEEFFQSAIKQLEHLLTGVTTPLVLSNGDYQPGNFLTKEGELTGFLDFECAAFHDPLMGFAKYPVYDLLPLSRTDVVDLFLETGKFSKREFSIRVALGCLKTLQKEIPVTETKAETRWYRDHVLGLLKSALSA